MPKEIWKPVMQIKEGARFAVSTRGRVRDLQTGKIHKPACTAAGFFVVRCREGKTRHSITLHRLMAETFLPGTPTYPVIFSNGNRKNCRLSNLRWSGLPDRKIRYRKLTDEQVREIRRKTPGLSQAALAKKYGVHRDTIWHVWHEKRFIGPQWMPEAASTGVSDLAVASSALNQL